MNGQSRQPNKIFHVVEAGSNVQGGAQSCEIGRDIKIVPSVLAAYCYQTLPPVAYDLVLLSAAIGHADRILTRRPSIDWGREIRLILPVHEWSAWNDSKVHNLLVDALNYVTGDCWSFEFYQNSSRLEVPDQTPLSLGNNQPIVLPYSGGMDSWSQTRLLASSGIDAILITSGDHYHRNCEWSGIKKLRGRQRRISIPFNPTCNTKVRRYREGSYRTRGFIFNSMAFLAAYLSKGNSVLIPEAAQGAWGLWFASVGIETPDTRSHPIFLSKLFAFLNVLLGSAVTYEMPSVWKTKGQVLANLAGEGLADQLASTVSCARGGRSSARGAKGMQCGVCAACLLRRQSVHRAGLGELEKPYFWDDLSTTTLDEIAGSMKGKSSDLAKKYAACGVLSLDQMARASSDPELFKHKAWEFSRVLGEPQEAVAKRMKRLLDDHSNEWTLFRESMGPDSFIHQIARYNVP